MTQQEPTPQEEIILTALETYLAAVQRAAKTMTARGMPEAASGLNARAGHIRTIQGELINGTARYIPANDLITVSPNTVKTK